MLLRDLLDLLSNSSPYRLFQYFPGQMASGLDQPCRAATMLQTLGGGSHTMTCWSLWWDMPVHLGEFSYVSFLTFMDFPSPTLTDIFSFVPPLFLIFIFLLIPFFIYCLVVFVCVCVVYSVNAEKFD